VKPSFVLRLAALLDFLIAVASVATPFLTSRVGLPMTLIFAAALVSGAGLLLVIAARIDSR